MEGNVKLINQIARGTSKDDERS